MNRNDEKVPSAVRSTAGERSAGPSLEAASRRRMLRLIAGGVPLMTSLPAAANIAATSAFRAAQRDAEARPAMVNSVSDGWIRMYVQIDEISVDDGNPFLAYRIQPDPGVASWIYYRRNDLDLTFQQVIGTITVTIPSYANAYMLVLFRNDGTPIGLDPTLVLGSAGLDGGGVQGLHCSSWRSIAGTDPATTWTMGCGV